MTKKLAKILIMGVLIIVVIGLFTACSGKDDGKIDICGETVEGKPMASVQVRAMLERYIFQRDDDIEIKIGFGFRDGRSIPSFVDEGAVVVVKIFGEGFTITDESDVEYNDEYQKEFTEYSENKFVCTLNVERYIPNYYEIFRLKLNQNSTSGTIIISAINLLEGSWEGDGDGQTVRVYYSADSDKIAFSAISVENAQKKLK